MSNSQFTGQDSFNSQSQAGSQAEGFSIDPIIFVILAGFVASATYFAYSRKYSVRAKKLSQQMYLCLADRKKFNIRLAHKLVKNWQDLILSGEYQKEFAKNPALFQTMGSLRDQLGIRTKEMMGEL